MTLEEWRPRADLTMGVLVDLLVMRPPAFRDRQLGATVYDSYLSSGSGSPSFGLEDKAQMMRMHTRRQNIHDHNILFFKST